MRLFAVKNGASEWFTGSRWSTKGQEWSSDFSCARMYDSPAKARGQARRLYGVFPQFNHIRVVEFDVSFAGDVEVPKVKP